MAQIKQYTNKFEAIGTVKIDDKTFKIDSKKSNKWIYSSMRLILDCGGQTFETYLIGGFNPESHWDILKNPNDEWFKRGNYEGKKFVYDFDAQKRIKWEDRFDKEILATLDYGDKIRVKIGENAAEDFITQYDLVCYLEKNLINGMNLHISGNIAFEYTEDGSVIEKLCVNSIYTAFENSVPKYKKYVRVIIGNENTKGLEQSGSEDIEVNAFVTDFIKEFKEQKINKLVALPFTFYINKQNTPKYKTYIEKVFAADEKKYTEIVIEYTSEKTGDIKTISIEDITNDTNANAIEFERLLGKTDEEILAKYGGNVRRAVASGEVKTKNIFKDIKGDTKETNGVIKITPLFTKNKYKESEIYFLSDVLPQGVSSGSSEKKNASYKKSEPPKTQAKQESSKEDELDEILKGIL